MEITLLWRETCSDSLKHSYLIVAGMHINLLTEPILENKTDGNL